MAFIYTVSESLCLTKNTVRAIITKINRLMFKKVLRVYREKHMKNKPNYTFRAKWELFFIVTAGSIYRYHWALEGKNFLVVRRTDLL